MADTILRLRAVSKRYGARYALRDVDLELARGEILGILGPNGSGKSTALRIAAGVLGCDAGAVERPTSGAGQRLGYLPEGVPLYDALRVDDMVDFVARAKGLRGAEAGAACEEALERCDLIAWRGRRVGQLSKGTRQRVGFAQALLGAPELLLLDEATSGLDPLQTLAARALIRDGAEDRATVLCTHVLHEAAALCTRVLILREGVMVAEHRPRVADVGRRATELEAAFLEALHVEPQT